MGADDLMGALVSGGGVGRGRAHWDGRLRVLADKLEPRADEAANDPEAPSG